MSGIREPGRLLGCKGTPLVHFACWKGVQMKRNYGADRSGMNTFAFLHYTRRDGGWAAVLAM